MSKEEIETYSETEEILKSCIHYSFIRDKYPLNIRQLKSDYYIADFNGKDIFKGGYSQLYHFILGIRFAIDNPVNECNHEEVSVCGVITCRKCKKTLLDY